MNAKRRATYYLVAAGLALALVAAAIVVAVVVLRAGSRSAELVLLQEQPPGRVLAVVEGRKVTIRDIQDTVYHSGQVFAAWPGPSSLPQRTFAAVDGIIIQAEVKRRGLTPTTREAWEYFKPNREACLASPDPDCREVIESLGYEVDEYWTLAFPGYRRELGRNELTSLLREGFGSAIDDDPAIRISKFYDDLRSNASIEWKDEAFRLMYEVVLAEERERIADPTSPETPVPIPAAGEGQATTPTVEECRQFFQSVVATYRAGSEPVDVLLPAEEAEGAREMAQACDDVFRNSDDSP